MNPLTAPHTAWMRRILGAWAGGFAALFLAFPGWRDSLLVEDGAIESATAFVFAVAFVLGVRSARNHPDRSFWLVPGFAALGVLDELSFGARIFGFTPPTIGGVEFDSLHDVFDLGDVVLAELGIGRTVFAAGVLALGLFVVAWLLRSGRGTPVIGWLRVRPHVSTLGVAISMLVVAVTVDQVWTTHVSRFVEEMLEFGAAGAVALAAAGVRISEEVAA